MLPALIILTLIVAVVLTVSRRTLFPFLEKARINKRLRQEGVEAEAVLLNLQQTGLYLNKLPQVKLEIQVQTRTGRNFVTETKEVLSFLDIAQLHIGGTLMVKYNPSNMKEVTLVR